MREVDTVPERRHDSRGPVRYPRTARVNQVLREVLAEELERRADIDDRLRLATITSIDTTRDLRQAKVYLSSMSDELAEALGEQRSALQRAIGNQVRLKHTPQLIFVSDPAVSHGARVEEILRRLQRDEASAPEVSETDDELQAATPDPLATPGEAENRDRRRGRPKPDGA